MHYAFVAVSAFVAFGFGIGGVVADPSRGQVIAERWCADCHLVGPDQLSAMDGVPSFSEVAQREEVTADGLRAFLSSPHPLMPDMALTRSEIRALVAYISTLK